MSKRLQALLSFGFLLLVFPTGALAKVIPGQYIVVLKEGADQTQVVADHERNKHADVLQTYGHAVKGYSARLSATELGDVKGDPRVDYVVQDQEGKPATVQSLPSGVNRIDADLSPAALFAGNGGGDVNGDVAVFDSGIQTNHPDLNVVGGVNCLGSYGNHDGTIGDQFGHGTHVAGTIGARDDLNGVVGVAPGVRLWSVRDLDAIGSGSISTQLCGIDWITANGPALGIRVANSSQVLFDPVDDGNCGNTNGGVLHQAICRSTAAGILWVFGAGNSAADYNAGAGPSFDEVLTVTGVADSNGLPNVGSTQTFSCTTAPIYGTRKKDTTSSTEVEDKYTSFSSFAKLAADQAHTVAAPGACINSTYKGSAYGKLSGTSMSAPHVTGTAELCILSGQCSGTPAQTIQKLRSDAAAYNQANPGYGFIGDPLHAPVSGRYYGYLIQAKLY